MVVAKITFFLPKREILQMAPNGNEFCHGHLKFFSEDSTARNVFRNHFLGPNRKKRIFKQNSLNISKNLPFQRLPGPLDLPPHNFIGG